MGKLIVLVKKNSNNKQDSSKQYTFDLKQTAYNFKPLTLENIPKVPKYTYQEKIFFSSAKIQKSVNTYQEKKYDFRPLTLKKFLKKYHSPLSDYATDLILYSDKYHLPWTLVVAISGVESTFCRHIPKNSYNCWGWNNGNHRFKNYSQAIEVVSQTLKYKYFNRGLVTLEKINKVYAPTSSVWSSKVHYFTFLISLPSKNSLPHLQISI